MFYVQQSVCNNNVRMLARMLLFLQHQKVNKNLQQIFSIRGKDVSFSFLIHFVTFSKFFVFISSRQRKSSFYAFFPFIRYCFHRFLSYFFVSSSLFPFYCKVSGVAGKNYKILFVMRLF